ncbi:MAG TPA: heavy metal sensor histidine kinase, partial [Verrucomicrobiae bacterium]|nr:heavy metal sensor histidine kinase [Verrucomicrobiae bacterium]
MALKASQAAQGWSITRRLALLYVASTVLLLVLASGFLYWVLARNLEREHSFFVANKIQALRLVLNEHANDASILSSEVELEPSAVQPARYYIRMLDAKRAVAVETRDMKDQVPVDVFPAPVQATAIPAAGTRWSSPGGSVFLLMSALSPTGAAGKGDWTLQVALDVSPDESVLASYRWTFMGVLLVGAVFAAGAGVFIARKGMEPLTDIAKTAHGITASHLHERIAASRWPAELRELAGAFDAMLDRLEASFTRLSQFSADLAHELRTPINNLRGEAEVALARPRSAEEYQQILASSLEECERLSRMIDGMLFLARAENPDSALERVPVDAQKEVKAVLDFYEALAREQDVRLVAEGGGSLRGDPDLFRRALSNLLTNALQHTPAKGTIRVSIRQVNDGTTRVEVRDNGSGIAAEHLPRIFDRFYRVDRSRSEPSRGTG